MLKLQLKKLFGESAIYGLSSIATKLISIFLIPLYTTVLTPSDYGTLNLISALFSFLLLLSVFSLDHSAARWFYETKDIKDKKSTIASWFYFQLLLTILISILIIVFKDILESKVLKIDDPYLLPIAALSFCFGALPTITPNWFRMKRKVISTVVYTIMLSLLTIGLTVYFVLIKGEGVRGIFLANFLSNLIMSIVSLFILKDWINIKFFNLSRLKELIKFALPLIPTVTAFWILNSSGSFVIEYFNGKSELGLFQIGITIASGVSLLVTAFRMAFPPFAFSIYKQEYSKSLFAVILSIYTIVMVSASLTLALFSRELLIAFTQPSYYEASQVTGILLFSNIVYGYSNIVGLGSLISKDSKPLAVSVFIGSAITAVLFFVLIPKWGKEGAAIGMMCGYLFIPIYTYIASQKRWFIPFKPAFSVGVFIVAILLFYLNYSIEFGVNGSTIKFRLLLILIYLLIALLLLRTFDKQTFKKIMEFVTIRLKSK